MTDREGMWISRQLYIQSTPACSSASVISWPYWAVTCISEFYTGNILIVAKLIKNIWHNDKQRDTTMPLKREAGHCCFFRRTRPGQSREDLEAHLQSVSPCLQTRSWCSSEDWTREGRGQVSTTSYLYAISTVPCGGDWYKKRTEKSSCESRDVNEFWDKVYWGQLDWTHRLDTGGIGGISDGAVCPWRLCGGRLVGRKHTHTHDLAAHFHFYLF